MGTTTLEVPAEYADAFRDALLVEIRTDAERLASAAEEIQRSRFTHRPKLEEARQRGNPEPIEREEPLDDVQGGHRSIVADLAIVEQAFASADDAMTITGDLEAISYALESMADKVLSPILASELNTSPVGDNLEAITHLTSAIEWAVRESARLNALWLEAREEVA